MSQNKNHEAKRRSNYHPPQIIHQGQLKQFAGSPLGKDKGLGLPGLPGQ